MDTVEQGLLKLQQQKDEDIKKYQLLFAQSVMELTRDNKTLQSKLEKYRKTLSCLISDLN